MDFLRDNTFLQKVNRYKVKNYYASIDVLDFETEEKIATITGKVISGNINIAANSVTRRTGSLSILYDESTYNITEISNLIAIDKKIRVLIGIENPLDHTLDYSKYGKVLWFRQGIFFITGVSLSVSTSTKTINVNFIDKMGKLNGVCGGTFPATVNLHEEVHIDKDKRETYTNPIIRDIIYNLVHFYGGEDSSRIIIEDVPDVGRQVVRYTGEEPLYISKNTSAAATNKIIKPHRIGESYGADDLYKFEQNEIAGYYETPLTYPGELIMKAGGTVTQALDSIKNTLGHYEYFYDIDGNFVFRRIKDYAGTGEVGLNYGGAINDFDFQSSYFRNFSTYAYAPEFSNLELITQFSLTPKYDNIKNDFICWGTKTNTNNTPSMARYHLAIDKLPEYYPDNLCTKDIYVIKRAKTLEIVRYQADDIRTSGDEIVEIFSRNFEDALGLTDSAENFNWREELYRRALINYGSSTRGSDYDEELLVAWRGVFDPDNEDFRNEWNQLYPEEEWRGYNPAIKNDLSKIKYWLDIIDSSSPLGKFGVNRIGKRTKVIENDKISDVFSLAVPDFVYVDNLGDPVEMDAKKTYYSKMGQDFTIINEIEKSNFSFINSYSTCFEEVRQMLYNYLIYNSSISLTCIPILYMDVNRIAHLNFSELNISGDFLINSISFQIGPSMGTMSIQLNEAITIN